jgi:hypothetical protein
MAAGTEHTYIHCGLKWLSRQAMYCQRKGRVWFVSVVAAMGGTISTALRLPNHPARNTWGQWQCAHGTVTTNLLVRACSDVRQRRKDRLAAASFRDTPLSLPIPFFFFHFHFHLHFHHTPKSSTPYCFHGSFTRPASSLLRRKHITANYRHLALIQFSAVLLHSLVPLDPFTVFPVLQSSLSHSTASCKLLTSDNGCRRQARSPQRRGAQAQGRQ